LAWLISYVHVTVVWQTALWVACSKKDRLANWWTGEL